MTQRSHCHLAGEKVGVFAFDLFALFLDLCIPIIVMSFRICSSRLSASLRPSLALRRGYASPTASNLPAGLQNAIQVRNHAEIDSYGLN